MRYPASPRIRLFWLALVCLGAGLILYPSASVAESRAFRWQSLSMPSGGRVAALAMAPDDPNTLLAATDAGVYLSRDGGARWSENSRGLPTPDILTVAISPANPSYYYAGGLRGLFRSRDRGQTWERVGGRLAAETVTVVVPDPRDSKVLYAGTIRAFFKSSDGGDNWQALDQAVFSTTTIWTAAVVPAQPQVVYAGGDGSALYRSGDAGASWRVVNSGLPAGARVQHIAVHPQTPAILFAATTRGLFRSGDGGANWTAAGGSACQDAALSIEFDRLNPSTLYAGLGQGGVCRSVDNGETWTPANSGLPHTPLLSLVVNPLNPKQIFTATGNGVYGTRNGGDSWAELNRGFGNAILWLNVPPGKPPLVLAATRWGVARTTGDEADGWERVGGELANAVVLAAAVDPRNPQRRFAGTAQGEVFRSDDGGMRWRRAGLLAGGAPISTLAVQDLPAVGTVYAGTAGSGVFASIDGGVSWSPLNDGLDQLRITFLYAAYSSPYPLFAVTAGGVYGLRADQPQAGDARWEAIGGLRGVPITAIAADPQNPAVVYAASRDSVFKSDDGGRQWQRLAPGRSLLNNITSLAVAPSRSNIIYAGLVGGFSRSNDGGQTWVPAAEGLPPQAQVTHLIASPDEPGVVYAGTAEDGLYRGEDLSLRTPSERSTASVPTAWVAVATVLAILGVVAGGFLRTNGRLPNLQVFSGAVPRLSQMLTGLRVQPRRPTRAATSDRDWHFSEAQWRQVNEQIETGLLESGEVMGDALRTLPVEQRSYALKRYFDDHPEQAISLQLNPAAIRLEDPTGVQSFMRRWQQAARGAETGGSLESLLTRITKDWCSRLDWTLVARGLAAEDAPPNLLHGFVVRAPSLRLRVPEQFPLIYVPPRAVAGKTGKALAEMIGALDASPDFAVVIALTDLSDRNSMAALRKAAQAVPGAVVLDGRAVGQIAIANEPERKLVDLIFEQVKLSRLSPYSTTGPVPESMFFGREREVRTITNRVHAQSFAVVGAARTGKTSLLMKVQRLLSATTGFYPLYLDCQNALDAKSLLEAMRAQWGVQRDSRGSAVDRIRRYLQETHTAQKQQGNTVVYLLDGVEPCLRGEPMLVDLFKAASADRWGQWVFAGGRALTETLAGRFSECEIMPVGPVSPDDAHRMVEEPMADMGVALEDGPELVEQIRTLSAGHPNLIQFICQHLLASLDRSVSPDSRRISANDLESARQASAFDAYASDLLWGDTTPAERRLASLMVVGQATRAELQSAIAQKDEAMSEDDLQRALDGLELCAIVQKDSDQYYLTSPSVAGILSGRAFQTSH